MTVEKGAAWGTRVVAPNIIETSTSDQAVALVSGSSPQCILGGELWKCLGEPELVTPGQWCHRVEIDALVCVVTTPKGVMEWRAASHIQIGTWLGVGRFIVLSNTGFIGSRRIAPRAHPNDGVVDVIELSADMSWRQRLLARKKSLQGIHIPHPAIQTSQVASVRFGRLRRRERLIIDGRRIKQWDSIVLTVESNYWQVLL